MKKMESCGNTDIGLRRTNNEDVFYIDLKRGFCLVADGMGGAAAGELASAIFAESVRETFSKISDLVKYSATDLVKSAFQSANNRIHDHVSKYPGHRGMGCTAEVLLFTEDELILGHIGDSRTYRYRDGILKQMTRDHSLVQGKIESGQITIKEARKHPLRNVILKAVGNAESSLPDIIRVKPLENDLFLVCSDGLTDFVDDDQICDVLSVEADLGSKVKMLIGLAKAGGGLDNITIVLWKFG